MEYEIGFEWKTGAHVGSLDEYRKMYKESVKDPETFWARQARRLVWDREFHTVRDTDFSNAVLVGANLRNADVTGANFSGADLRGARLAGVIGLTAEQLLDEAPLDTLLDATLIVLLLSLAHAEILWWGWLE